MSGSNQNNHLLEVYLYKNISPISSMIMQRVSKLLPILLGVLCLYSVGYAYARMSIFHAVEHYAGAEGKSKPRQDYITKKDRTPGEGWEYQLFLPAIKVEESLVNYFHNL